MVRHGSSTVGSGLLSRERASVGDVRAQLQPDSSSDEGGEEAVLHVLGQAADVHGAKPPRLLQSEPQRAPPHMLLVTNTSLGTTSTSRPISGCRLLQQLQARCRSHPYARTHAPHEPAAQGLRAQSGMSGGGGANSTGQGRDLQLRLPAGILLVSHSEEPGQRSSSARPAAALGHGKPAASGPSSTAPPSRGSQRMLGQVLQGLFDDGDRCGAVHCTVRAHTCRKARLGNLVVIMHACNVRLNQVQVQEQFSSNAMPLHVRTTCAKLK